MPALSLNTCILRFRIGGVLADAIAEQIPAIIGIGKVALVLYGILGAAVMAVIVAGALYIFGVYRKATDRSREEFDRRMNRHGSETP